MSYRFNNDVEVARNYYNSSDADNFYSRVWGGEDLHVGIYSSDDEDIFTASRRTIERMAEYAKKIDKNTKIIDLGGGYGGTGRFLARNYGCHVTVINLSETENERGRKLNREQKLDHLVDIIDGSYDDIDFPDNEFDIVWSEDAFLHSDSREEALKEAARVLKKGGDFIFTDPMQTDNCDEGVLQPIYDRLQLPSLGSPDFYRKTCKEYGMLEAGFDEMPEQLATHYNRVLQETVKNEDELKNNISDEYLTRMKKGLNHWVNGGRNGNLTWGIFHFKNQ